MNTKRRLPTLNWVGLRDFSLFSNQRSIEISTGDGVFCLAGANGLGKSSFLAAVNFGYTGIVADPTESFRSPKEYYDDSLEYSKRFFNGRIDELDRNTAEVSLRFTVANKEYLISRNLFCPQELTELKISGDDGVTLLEDADTSGDVDRRRDIHSRYAANIVRDCNLGNFFQFVFLQHFLFTFDERRHLLFWDPGATDPALYLAFGMDGEEAAEADELRRLANKAESNARNAQWQATQARNRLNELGIEPSNEGDEEDLVEKHRTLSARADEAITSLEDALRAQSDADVSYAEASAYQQSVRHRYDRAFAQRLGERHDPRLHPTIQNTLLNDSCDVCGSTDNNVAKTIEDLLESRTCPLCRNSLDDSSEDASLDELKALDQQLAEAHKKVKSASMSVERLAGEVRVASVRRSAALEELSKFEIANQSRIPGLGTASGALVEQRTHLLKEKSDAERRRDDYRRRRDEYRERLRPLQEKLSDAYREGELEFVPLFRQLAKQFIGLDLDVFLGRRQESGFQLDLEVQGKRRRLATQLSESQRFFLDIALRMALAQHMSDPAGKATLLIDTPEGSLDIAYEARAGQMFSDFVSAGFHIVMTANINASQLLQQLAARCGGSRMRLIRMTEWAPLSEVQAEGEELFDNAYQRIETLLANASAESER